MAVSHLLSKPLYDELFQHNIISRDGRILANDDKLNLYKTFLLERSRDKTAENFKERNSLMVNVQRLLKDTRKSTSNKEMETLVKQLGLHFTKDKMLSCNKITEPPKRFLGPSSPKLSLHERQSAVRKISKKVQKRDLKLLDNWLTCISDPKTRVQKMAPKTTVEWKEEELKHRAKVEIFFVVIACLIFLKMSILSDSDWRNEDYEDPLESMSKYLMTAGCSTPGLRLMCTPDGKEFPLDQLTYLDTICGCFFYSTAFVTFLWLMTPFPDISSTVFLRISFTQGRAFQDENIQEQPNIPGFNPAGGEGDAENPPVMQEP